jgi:hypothetical protein
MTCRSSRPVRVIARNYVDRCTHHSGFSTLLCPPKASIRWTPIKGHWGCEALARRIVNSAVDYIYDGPSSTIPWDQCTPPNCVAKFPVWFTGEQKPNGYLVKQEFEANGPGTFHYLEGLSQYNGAAIWLRSFPYWSGAWKGLISQYITTISLSKSGQVNSYGLGTLLHEVLHKQSVGGGFTHANMSQALGLGSCAAVGTQNGCSNAIAAACFPQ